MHKLSSGKSGPTGFKGLAAPCTVSSGVGESSSTEMSMSLSGLFPLTPGLNSLLSCLWGDDMKADVTEKAASPSSHSRSNSYSVLVSITRSVWGAATPSLLQEIWGWETKIFQAAGNAGTFQVGSKVRATYQLWAKAGRGGKPHTWQNWEHPPRGQGAADSTLSCPDSRYKCRIFLCSSPHRPTWRRESYVWPCLVGRESRSSRVLLCLTHHINVLLCGLKENWDEGIMRWWNFSAGYSTCQCSYRTKCQQINLRYNSLFQDLLTIQIMGTILKGTYRKLLYLGMKIQRHQRAADLQTGWAANHVSSRGALKDPGSENTQRGNIFPGGLKGAEQTYWVLA